METGASLHLDDRSLSSRRWFLAIWTTAILLRVALASVNLDSNDFHHPVIHAIAFDHHFPSREEMWEGFQPKFFHWTAAMLWRAMGTRDIVVLYHAAEYLNVVAGILTLAVVHLLLARSPVGEDAKIISFGMVALNPTMIGINAQVTNDSFAILFGTLTIFAGYQYFLNGKTPWALTAGGAAGLAWISKGTGIVLVIALSICFALSILEKDRSANARKRVALTAMLCVALAFAITLLFSPYLEHWHKYGSPFVINMKPDPWVGITRSRPAKELGVQSILGGFFTFRWLALMSQPQPVHPPPPFYVTSYWTTMFAWSNFVDFGLGPPTWTLSSHLMQFAARAAYVLGLYPAWLFMVALLRSLRSFISIFTSRLREKPALPYIWMSLTALGFLGMNMVFASRYREMSTMKPVYVFPGILAFAFLFAQILHKVLANKPRRIYLVRFIFALLFLVYGVQIVALTAHLAREAPPQFLFDNRPE